MFRGKESSNRIELSRLVQDLLNFGVLGSLRLWGWGGGWMGVEGGWGWVDGDGGWLGVPPTPIHPPPHPPGGDPRNQSKFNSTSTNRDISIPFEDLKSVETSPPMGGCMVWWVGGWVGGLMGGVRSKH